MRRALVLVVVAACGGGSNSPPDAAVDAVADSFTSTESPTATAFLTMDKVSVDFGTVAVGQSADVSFVLTNTGGLTSGAPTITTTDPAFTIISPACGELAAAETCNIVVELAPASVGPTSGFLEVSASPGGTVDAELTGTGSGVAMLAITPSPEDFGVACIGSASAAHTFTVTNNGTDISGAITSAIIGSDADSFGLVSSTCVTLAPLASCQVTVTFESLTVGAKAASLQVGATPGGTASATLLGTGVAPGELSITSATPFQSTPVFELSAAQTITVSHGGACGPTTGPLSIALGGNDPAQFEIVTDTCSGVALQPDAECTISVAFAPTVEGLATANLTVDGIPGGVASTGLSGTGLPNAILSITPEHDFGEIPPNTTSAPVPITVTNIGALTTGPLSQALAGPNSTQWELISSTCDGVSLAAGASCDVVLEFAPTIINANDQADLVVSGAPGGTVSAVLVGNGFDEVPLSSGGTSFLNFADTVVGQVSAPLTVTATNLNGFTTGTLHTDVIGTDPTQFTVVTNTCDGSVLAPQAQCTITFAFAPTTDSPATKSATLDLTAPNGGFDVALAGKAVAP